MFMGHLITGMFYSHLSPIQIPFRDYKQPYPFGTKDDFKVTFDAVHDFIIPEADDGTTLAAVYHAASPAWGVQQDTLYGAILRNTPEVSCADKGAAGSDSRIYDIHYAIRVPSGLATPTSGQPLREARAYHTPLRAVFLDQIKSTPVPTEYSLGHVVAPSSVVISSVKKGTVEKDNTFLRIYSPENRPVDVQLNVDTKIVQGSVIRRATALEEEGENVVSDVDNGWRSFEILGESALSTISLK